MRVCLNYTWEIIETLESKHRLLFEDALSLIHLVSESLIKISMIRLKCTRPSVGATASYVPNTFKIVYLRN